MRKRKKGRKLKRTSNQRKALLRSLARELFLRGKIKTTLAKAKEVSVFAQKQITKGKKGGLNAKRFLARNFSKDVVKKITDEIVPRYKTRKGGYTRIIKLEPRKSDGAKIAIIELVE
ncbi:MAG TPA: 50S ribosomal protein L17 [bacterium]|nr:50S ribosomal protein L17 [bacterium]